MGRDAAGKHPASEYLEHRRKLLRMTDPDRLLEVLSEGYCSNCRFLLHQRLRLLLRTTRRWHHHPRDFTTESRDHDCNSELSYHGNDDTPESCRRRRRHRSPEWISYSASREYAGISPTEESRKRKRGLSEYSESDLILDDGIGGISSYSVEDLSEEQKEKMRFSKVRKQEFVHMERIGSKLENVLQGLELHTGVFNKEEQKNIVDFVYHLQRKGRRGQLKKRTYSEPRKWMRGKGRVTIQFGCCYNYAVDKKGNPPGIVRDEEVDPLPSLFKKVIRRMVKWHILPITCVPDSCIVNIYDKGDCIPPHIDHHDFVRPFCTVSFVTESNILFGSRLEILSPGEFSGPVSIPLPKGSVLILSGNGADLAKHCVPSVPAKRISITFRKMDDRKLPYKFLPDHELQRIKPLDLSQLQEEEEKNVQVEEGEIKQREHHHYYSPKSVDLTQWQEEEKHVQVEEGEIIQRNHYYSPKPLDLSQLLEEEEKNVQVKEGKRKQRNQYHHYSLKPLDLFQWQEEVEKNVKVKEGERKQRDHHHYSSLKPLDFSQLQEEEKNVEVKERERKQSDHHHYCSPKASFQRSKRQRYEDGVW